MTDEFLKRLEEHSDVHIKEHDEETGLVTIEVPHVIPRDIDEIIRASEEIMINRKSHTVFEITLP